MKAAMMTEAALIPGVALFQNLNPASELLNYPLTVLANHNEH